MKTHAHIRDDGSVAYFEISNALPWSFGFMRRVLTTVPDVSDVKRIWFSDDRYSFRYLGRDCVVHEPFGDNSRYWIGPAEVEPPIDMAQVRDAFARFSLLPTFDRDFKKSGPSPSTRSSYQAALPQAANVLSNLRAMSYQALAKLPAHETVELGGFGKRVTVTTYVDALKDHDSELQVVVQLAAHGRLGFSRVWARGFRASRQGGYRDLEEKELYEYS